MRWQFLLFGLLALSACRNHKADAETKEPSEFVAARNAVIAVLRDPGSARFSTLTRGLGDSVCGSVNAKNGFGGYTGARPFAWSPTTGVILYNFEGDLGQWRERGEIAEQFARLGCSIGKDQTKAVAALRALEESDRRIAE